MNKRLLKILITILVSVCVLLEAMLPAYAEGSASVLDLTGMKGINAPPSIDAPSAILMEANTGAILYAKDAYSPYHPASVTKVMTALLTLENCSLDETVTFSYRATHELEEGASSIARTEGEELSVEECLYALLVASANEVAQALAEHVGGSLEQFSQMMTARAKELGCKDTYFANPSGLNDPAHHTTCFDMAMIMRKALQDPTFVKIDSTTSHVIPATNKHKEELGIAMKHKLLLKGDDHYEYAQCGKTGYTSIAGYNLVTTAKKGSMNLICVVLGCKDSNSRYTSTKALFDYGFKEFTLLNIAENDSDFKSNELLAADKSFLSGNLVALSMPQNNYVIVPDGVDFSQLKNELVWRDDASPGDEIATLVYRYRKVKVGEVRLTIAEGESSAYDFLRENTTLSAEIEKDELENPEKPTEAAPIQEKAGGPLLIAIIVLLSLLVLLLIILIILKLRQDGRRKKRRSKHTRRSYHSSRF
ncbi:MAG: D-alanyl-D-alanine carboxypeptidase [Lachnospiraceae bacterium]|nr:D-alanyl-D-alanine carboxypeptidase [Lachnospiraceae bacterium]